MSGMPLVASGSDTTEHAGEERETAAQDSSCP